MTYERFNEILENLKLEKFKWLDLTGEIESLVLKNNIGIYPNWKHHRFLITDKSILVKHGDSVPYGARLSNIFTISADFTGITFPGKLIVPTPFYNDFRIPKRGDILCASYDKDTVYSCVIVEEVINAMNGTFIKLSQPLKIGKEFHLSFYDPLEYLPDICMHGEYYEGIYMKFLERPGKKSKYGVFHETIKIKNIQEINLKLSAKLKTYKLT